MKLGIMQPYVFPYFGYFQLISAVDKFVFYDDVNYIKQGWINRNKILLGGKALRFTIPVTDSSSSRPINETALNEKIVDNWKKKFYRTLETAYAKAPCYKQVLALVVETLDSNVKSIGDLGKISIKKTAGYLGIRTDLVESSAKYQNKELKSVQRVVDICIKESATFYINAPGGSSLYDKKSFDAHNISLQFIRPGTINYPQFENEFVPALSVIDVMMFNSIDTIKRMLTNYTLT